MTDLSTVPWKHKPRPAKTAPFENPWMRRHVMPLAIAFSAIMLAALITAALT